MAPSNTLRLYEALELRAEYDARLKTFKDCLPEARREHRRLNFIYKEDRDIVEDNERSYTECATALEEVRLSFRALNRAIRAAAFEVSVDFQDE
ncbi:MAG: hypothetical protein HYW07_19860 [Candidatus Latescibacteria bacterium]|nr:hypothetical protein [Candidatus Latescibacterota bacterium]